MTVLFLIIGSLFLSTDFYLEVKKVNLYTATGEELYSSEVQGTIIKDEDKIYLNLNVSNDTEIDLVEEISRTILDVGEQKVESRLFSARIVKTETGLPQPAIEIILESYIIEEHKIASKMILFSQNLIFYYYGDF